MLICIQDVVEFYFHAREKPVDFYNRIKHSDKTYLILFGSFVKCSLSLFINFSAFITRSNLTTLRYLSFFLSATQRQFRRGGEDWTLASALEILGTQNFK